jgi:hypothetical protein
MTLLEKLYENLREIEATEDMDDVEKLLLLFQIKELIAEEEMKQFLEQ